MSTGRNDPCPCGSGKKYKRCCLVHGDPQQAARNRLIMLLVAVVLVAAVILGIAVSQAVGLAAGVVGLALIGVWLWLFAPPPKSSGGADPSAINYGR